ncbi:hypothetical protein BC831DRAFT_486783 [Entophlyctis helioformis]|nr:hypothetical protein BC831DRAFT_486783 [Entophlyctis helioformis]
MHTLAVHAIPLVEPKTEPAGVDSRGGSECDAAAQAVDASADAGAGVDGSVEPECGSKMSAELDDDTRRKEEQRRLAAQMYNERRRAERARRKAARLSALADAENAGMHDGVGGWTADAAAGSDGANGMGSAGSGTVADAVMSRREAQRELAAQMHNTRRRDSLARTSTATTATEAAVTSGRRTLRSMDSGTHSCVDAYGRAATYGSADDDDDAKQVRTNTAHALHTRPSRHASREASTDTAGCHSGFFDRWGQRRFIINAAALASALQEAETVLLSRSLYGRPDGSDIAEAAMMRVVRGMDGYGWTGVREKGSASGMDGGAATDAVTALRRSSETDCKQRYWPSTKLATPAAESVDRTSVGRPGGSVAVAAEPLYYVHDSPVDVMGSATLSTNGQGQPQQQANAANTAPTTPLKPALVAALSALDMTYLRGLAKSIPDLDLPIASLTAAGQHFVVDTLARMSIMRVVRLAPHGLADGDIPDPVRTDIAAFDAEMSGVVRAIYSRRDDVQVSSDELAVAKSVVEDLAMHGIHAFTSSRVAQSIFGWLSHPSVASWTINQFAALFTKLAAHYATIVQQTHAKIRSVFVDNVRLVGFDAAFAAHNAELSRSRRNRSSLTTSGAMAAGIVAASPALSSNDTVSSVTEPELQVLQPQQAQHEQPTWTRACDSVSDAAITAALTLPPLDTLTGDLTVNQLSRLVGALKATATTVLDSLVAADVDESLAPAPLASSLEHLRARLVPASGSDEHMRAVADEIQAFVDMGPAVYAATRCAEYLDNWQTYPCIAGWSVKHLVVTYAVYVGSQLHGVCVCISVCICVCKHRCG